MELIGDNMVNELNVGGRHCEAGAQLHSPSSQGQQQGRASGIDAFAGVSSTQL